MRRVVVCAPFEPQAGVQCFAGGGFACPVGGRLRACCTGETGQSSFGQAPKKCESLPGPMSLRKGALRNGTWAANPRLGESHSICLCPVQLRSCAASTLSGGAQFLPSLCVAA